jgi:hypothetical protein
MTGYVLYTEAKQRSPTDRPHHVSIKQPRPPPSILLPYIPFLSSSPSAPRNVENDNHVIKSLEITKLSNYVK